MQPLVNFIPERVRVVVLTVLYGVVGGLAATGFMVSINAVFRFIWTGITSRGLPFFFFSSLAVLAGTSLLSGILLTLVCPQAAGSGIPQLKAAYWKETGVVPFRATLTKFFGGILAIGGGASLGREGPTVFIASGLTSLVAGGLGIPQRNRRHASAAGAAAGLAAAFNTPLAAISFVLEELLGDLNSRLLGSVALASVTGAFVVYALIGRQPSFTMPNVDSPSWDLYLAVPIAAALAALSGVLFQRGSLSLRRRSRTWKKIPAWLHPLAGGLVTWLLGAAVYMSTQRLGVFGLGYDDLSRALVEGMGWKLAVLLALAKLTASIASYGTGGCGGIFSPTLFIGAMCGFLAGDVAAHWIPLTDADRLILAATGMSACFGAVVRAPFTAILMIFEMTHQFGMVPALMLGTLLSQALARLAGPLNFYEAVLEQDGHELHKIAPPRDLSAWRNLPVSALANRKPVVLSDLSPASLRAALEKHPYRCFPVIQQGATKGVLTREEVQRALSHGITPAPTPTVVCLASQTLAEVDSHLIASPSGLFLVADREGGPPVGVFTLHDLLRAQAALLE